jgi:hypothetical protein
MDTVMTLRSLQTNIPGGADLEPSTFAGGDGKFAEYLI